MIQTCKFYKVYRGQKCFKATSMKPSVTLLQTKNL